MATPTAIGNRRILSIASVMSDLSGYNTTATHSSTPFLALSSPNWHSYAMPMPVPKQQEQQEPKFQQLLQHHIKISKDDFGLSRMMAVIECKSTQSRTALPPLHSTHELLFGRPVDLEELHFFFFFVFFWFDNLYTTISTYMCGLVSMYQLLQKKNKQMSD